MKSVIHKAYWNYEKEEKWLNEMAAKGLALTDYSWCRYVFADCVPGEYVYRIELLEHMPDHPISRQYIQFMEESGVEYVASYMRWVYFRKAASDGAFDIYSDIDSKLRHYRRIHAFWCIVGFAEMLIGIPNIIMGFPLSGNPNRIYAMNLMLGCIVFVLGIAFIALGHPLRKKISKLKKEKTVRE